MSMKTVTTAAAAAIGALMMAGSAQAAVTTFSGFDAGANAPGANAAAAATAFNGAVGASTLINFESPVPAGVSIVGGTVTNVPEGSPPALYGGNTTSGGAFFLDLFGGTSVFNFTTPISAFGFFTGGNQLSGETVTFTDSSRIMLKLASMNEASRKNIMSISGIISIRAFLCGNGEPIFITVSCRLAATRRVCARACRTHRGLAQGGHGRPRSSARASRRA